MQEKLDQYLDGVFAAYEGVQSVDDLKANLQADLKERYNELKAQGKSDEEALKITIDSIGDIEATLREYAHASKVEAEQSLTKFSARNLDGSDFSGTNARGKKFHASNLNHANFAGADLAGSSFKASNLNRANFDAANLSDVIFSTSNIEENSFAKSILVRTVFNMANMGYSKFSGVNFIGVKFSMNNMQACVFANCSFTELEFKYCNLQGVSFAGQTLNTVKFHGSNLQGLSFQGATLNNVTFTAPFSIFSLKKYYNNLNSVNFTEARMDKLSYNALQSMGVDLSKVTVI